MLDASLSPRLFFEHTRSSLALDQPVFGDYLLSDCYRLDENSPLCVELRHRVRDGSNQDRIEIGIEPMPGQEEGGPRFPAAVAGLGLSYRKHTPSELGLAACGALEQALRASLGEAPRRWTLLEPSLREIAEPVAAEVCVEPASLDTDPDRDLLRRDFEYYESLYGARPGAFFVYPRGGSAPGVSVFYPASRNGRVPNSAAVYPASTRISHRRRMRRYFATLGCHFDEEGIPRTVPSATTYTRALANREGVATIRPEMSGRIWGSMSPVYWGVVMRRGTLPITFAPVWAVELHRLLRKIQPFENIPCDVGMTVHDMGLHALAIHAMPAEAWDELVRLSLERVRVQPLSLLAGPWGVLFRLARFFEGPVTTRSWNAWRDADEPEQYERVFEGEFAALCAELREL